MITYKRPTAVGQLPTNYRSLVEPTTEQSFFRNFNNNLLTIVYWSEARKFMSPQVKQ